MANYFLAPASQGGSDSNDGLTRITPWLTPRHALHCGDVITALAGADYDATNFRPGEWGVVTCPSQNNVAWLQCEKFAACKINIDSLGHNGMTPTQSFWGIQGWEITASVLSGNQCFNAYPPDFTTTIHHVIFANNIANGCGDGAFTTGSSATGVGVDYVAIIGNIAYNGAQDNGECYSGIDIVVPENSDSSPGTHIYIAGNFTWGNVDPSPCAGGNPTDGHGISLDTISPYSGQIVIENNISMFNGATGIQSFLNNTGSPNAPIYIVNNTIYGNQVGSVNAFPCAEINLASSLSSQAFGNLVVSRVSTGCSVNGQVQPLYTFGVSSPDATDQIFNNFLYSPAGNNVIGSGPGFSYGPNITGMNPMLANPVQPNAPDCTGFSNVPACMATVVANFAPTNPTAKSFGYQAPSATPAANARFPQWLCTVTNLPAGLITMGCPGNIPPVVPPVTPPGNTVFGQGGISSKSGVANTPPFSSSLVQGPPNGPDTHVITTTGVIFNNTA